MFIIGLKKTRINRKRHYQILELNELYWFIGHKGKSKTRENVYLLTMVSRSPRQIVRFDVAWDKSPERIQRMVDKAPPSEMYTIKATHLLLRALTRICGITYLCSPDEASALRANLKLCMRYLKYSFVRITVSVLRK